ncbi:hypothetical protein ACTA71_007186 [Dictyostelium dimigraforme]
MADHSLFGGFLELFTHSYLIFNIIKSTTTNTGFISPQQTLDSPYSHFNVQHFQRREEEKESTTTTHQEVQSRYRDTRMEHKDSHIQYGKVTTTTSSSSRSKIINLPIKRSISRGIDCRWLLMKQLQVK